MILNIMSIGHIAILLLQFLDHVSCCHKLTKTLQKYLSDFVWQCLDNLSSPRKRSMLDCIFISYLFHIICILMHIYFILLSIIIRFHYEVKIHLGFFKNFCFCFLCHSFREFR